jgi:hypothetical protein
MTIPQDIFASLPSALQRRERLRFDLLSLLFKSFRDRTSHLRNTQLTCMAKQFRSQKVTSFGFALQLFGGDAVSVCPGILPDASNLP